MVSSWLQPPGLTRFSLIQTVDSEHYLFDVIDQLILLLSIIIIYSILSIPNFIFIDPLPPATSPTTDD